METREIAELVLISLFMVLVVLIPFLAIVRIVRGMNIALPKEGTKMKKYEFLMRIESAISIVRANSCNHSCVAISRVFSTTYACEYKQYSKIKERYHTSIKHLLFVGSPFIDWGKLGVVSADEKVVYRVKWLKDFREDCLRNKYYEEY